MSFYPRPAPGSRINTSANFWGDVTQVVNERNTKTGVETFSPMSGGGILNASNADDANYPKGSVLRIFSASTSPSGVSPAALARQPVWHGEIDSVFPINKPVLKDGGFTIQDHRWSTVRLSEDVSPGELIDLNFVMIDPEKPWLCKAASSGIWKILAKTADKEVLVDTAVSNHRWRYTLKENWKSTGTRASLRGIDGELFTTTTTEITLLDPEQLMSDQMTGDTGFCDLFGNKFYAIQATC